MDKIWTKFLAKDYKKALIRFLIFTVVFAFISVGTCAAIFGGRIKKLSDTMEQQEKVQEDSYWNETNAVYENDGEYEQNEKVKREERHEKDRISKEQIKATMNLSTGEKIMIIAFAIVGILLFIWYWIMIVGITVKLADKLGTNPLFFAYLALFTNVGALIILCIFKFVGKVCDNCGKVQSRRSAYCSKCGNKLVNICSVCGKYGSKKDSYCTQCGKKFDV